LMSREIQQAHKTESDSSTREIQQAHKTESDSSTYSLFAD